MSNFREYAILFHDCPNNLHGPSSLRLGARSHWDLLLSPLTPNTEDSHPLLCFEVRIPPEDWLGTEMSVNRLADHRGLYLEYEGPLTGNRGVVTRVGRGVVQWIKQNEEELIFLMPLDVSVGQSLLATASERPMLPELELQKLTICRVDESSKWKMKVEKSKGN